MPVTCGHPEPGVEDLFWAPSIHSGSLALYSTDVRIPEDAQIGYDPEHDRHYHHVTESGIVVVAGNRSSVDISTMFV